MFLKIIKKIFLFFPYGIREKNENKKYGITSFTKKGEIVKSKAEKDIANFFYKHDIKYIYEKDLIVNGKKVANPDFYLVDYDLWVEFWGLVKNEKYNKIMKFKMAMFHKQGIKFISLYRKDIYSKYGFYEDRLIKNLIFRSKKYGITIKELKK